MNIQPAHALDATQIETDVAILGGGAAGLALAANLESDCIVVESGIDRLEPARHGWQQAINRGEATNVDSLRVRGIGGATLRWTEAPARRGRGGIAGSALPARSQSFARRYANWRFGRKRRQREPENYWYG